MNNFILLNILFYLTLSITLFDLDFTRAKKLDNAFSDEPSLPWWVGLVDFVCMMSWLVILFINSKFAILGIIVYYASAFIPLPQIIGNILMSPFKPKVKNK